jgi:hypothetical protein
VSTLTTDTLVWWQPTGATRPRRAVILSAAHPRYIVQVVDSNGAPDPLWWPKEAEAGDLRPVQREAA